MQLARTNENAAKNSIDAIMTLEETAQTASVQPLGQRGAAKVQRIF